MLEYLKRLLKQKEERKKELAGKAKTAAAVEELRSINSEMDALNDEIAELRSEIEKNSQEPPAGGSTPPAEGRGQQLPNDGQGQQTTGIIGGASRGASDQLIQVLSSFSLNGNQRQAGSEDDKYGTLEYRQAFMQFAKTGVLAPEFRADAYSGTSDVSAVIPTTILDEVIRKMTTYGQIFNRVRKLNIKGGVQIPILSLKPSATWIGESSVSDRQKVTANTNISFSYFGLECKVAVSLLAETVTLSSFESTITDLITEAMIKAMDIAIISGDGTGKMKGITQDARVPAGQIVTLSASDFTAWDQWKKKVFAKIPLSYRAGGSFIMAAGTFEGYIDGMVDANGQPIGRVNYGIVNGPQERFGGREVILVEDDVIAPYDSASTGDVVAVFCKLTDYGVNSNMQMQMYRWLDHDTNQWVDKALLIADGKLIDPNGVVIVKKGA